MTRQTQLIFRGIAGLTLIGISIFVTALPFWFGLVIACIGGIMTGSSIAGLLFEKRARYPIPPTYKLKRSTDEN
ncbi:hypothetical protein phiOC_p177 [Ochrobactrum phage vB_OspM_OC]|nr:hypothetical protein phiOC_p177 [Ochrobactrum phage vB_OspM_OC]